MLRLLIKIRDFLAPTQKTLLLGRWQLKKDKWNMYYNPDPGYEN